jgi:tetratricopeptide (TPR) repeat protein
VTRPWGVVAVILILAGAAVPVVAAQSLSDDPAFRLARQAQQALGRQDYSGAAEFARQAIAEYPDHVLAYYLLAQAALGQQQWQAAVDALSTVVRLYPKSFAAHRELGVALSQLGKGPDAITAFESALALRPTGPDAQDVQVRLAFLRLQAGQRDQALPLLVTLTEAGSTVPEVWAALARLQYEREKLPESERAYARAAELRDDGKTWFNLAVVRLRLFDKPGAIEALKRAAKHPDVQAQATAELKRLGAPGAGTDSGEKPARER